MTVQTALGTKLRLRPATLTHAVRNRNSNHALKNLYYFQVFSSKNLKDETLRHVLVIILDCVLQQLTANGASGVNGHNATRLAALVRKARCGHMPSLHSSVERSVKEMHKCQLSVTLWMI